ncbi:MAG TPA: hypothetical protein VKN99_16385, partial [Polyangia bacterium]|nr:hypothetical protein [Polyangia bacterium]
MARGRWRRRAALGLLGVASGLALLLYYYYAHTRLGLEQARERLQQRLQRTLPGLRIGRLVSWSIGGQVVLANVSVREPGGRAELHVEQVQLDLEPRSLWSDTIRIDRLQIRAPRVYVARDPAGLVRSSQRAGRSSGVAVGALEITDGAIELATARGIIAARRVTGRASFGAERVSAQLENAEWEGLTPGAPVKLRGTAAGPYDRIAVALSLDGAGGATGALDGYFARDGSYELSARTNGIPLQALGAQQPGRVQGIAQVRGRDRRAEVTLDLSGSSIADMAVEAAHASARFDGARWQLMSADLGAPGLALRAAGSGDGLTIALDIDGTIDERSALAHRLSELAGLRDLRARSRVHARVAGRLPGPLEMRGSLQASQLAFAGLLVAPADATFEVGGWPRATHGHAHLEARGPRWGGIATPVDSIALDLAMPGDASFRLRGTGTGARGRAALVAHGVAS